MLKGYYEGAGETQLGAGRSRRTGAMLTLTQQQTRLAPQLVLSGVAHRC